jgi:hypothetical protein
MTRKLLLYKTISGVDTLKMYEIPQSIQRKIVFQYTSNTDCTEVDVLEFQTTKIFDEFGYQDVLFNTMVSYFRLIKAPVDYKKYELDEEIEMGIRFVAQGELYRIDGTKYFFRGDFTKEDNPFYDVDDINFKDCILSIETGNYKLDFIIGYVHDDEGIERTRLILGNERMRSDYSEIYQAIRTYSFKRQISPRTILDQLKGKVL